MLRLLIVDNPHDNRTNDLKDKLKEVGLADEIHMIPFDEAVKVFPVQAAPSIFMLGTSDLIDEVDAKKIKEYVDFFRDKTNIESEIAYLGDIAVKARKVGIR
ncbi:hypothetical protein [Paenibacillus sp. PSB04]|uniref:hypothetical protein n=1 Tax=Paenibacillus sp. PSB04 TaxID=2866810 RepID=UPI0021F15512|nr:hypothetical protein [Paenibacillus sp. PSB04]UYO04898.1 hypothetical protein K2F33_02510 [Paenibacillus sp. PSB04]